MKTADKFSVAMNKLGLDSPSPRIAVGVSGGGDSLALCLLLQEWVAARGGTLLALTVDHGLRAESKPEAEAVHDLLKKRGIAHEILTWRGAKPATHIQERARSMRYELLSAACRRENFPALAVAHNAEDQMETFWMRLAHGSGLDGLAGIAPARDVGGVRLLRPLLDFTRAELRETCTKAGVEWVDDPSNANEKFLRPKLRGFEEMLAGEGLSPQRLANTLQKLEDARAALQFFTDHACASHTSVKPEGYATLDKNGFAAVPADIQRRLLFHLLAAIAPQEYNAGFDTVDALRAALLLSAFSGRTAAGCEIFAHDGGFVICREASGVVPAPVTEGMVWDERFKVSGYPAAESLTISLLGENGVAALRKSALPDSPALALLEGLPGKVRRSLPTIRKGENIVSVPVLGWVSADAPKGVENGSVTLVRR